MSSLRELSAEFTTKFDRKSFTEFHDIIDDLKTELVTLNSEMDKFADKTADYGRRAGKGFANVQSTIARVGDSAVVEGRRIDSALGKVDKRVKDLHKASNDMNLPKKLKSSQNEAEKLDKRIDDLGYRLRKVGRDKYNFGSGFSSLNTQLNSALSNMGLLTVAGVGGIALMASQSAKLGTEIINISKSLGITTEEFQQLEYLTAKHAGLNRDQTKDIMESFIVRMNEAIRGEGEGLEAIQILGISDQIVNSDGKLKSTKELLEIVADAFQKQNPQQQVDIADKLAEGEGVRFGNVLSLGSKGLEAGRREANDLGLVLSKETLEDVEKFRKEWVDTRFAMEAVRAEISLGFMPIINKFGKGLRTIFPKGSGEELAGEIDEYFKRIEKSISGIVSSEDLKSGIEMVKEVADSLGGWGNLAEAATLGITTVLGVFLLPKFAGIMTIATAITAIGAVVQDLNNYRLNRESVLGSLLWDAEKKKDDQDKIREEGIKNPFKRGFNLAYRVATNPFEIFTGDPGLDSDEGTWFPKDNLYLNMLQYYYKEPGKIFSEDILDSYRKANPNKNISDIVDIKRGVPLPTMIELLGKDIFNLGRNTEQSLESSDEWQRFGSRLFLRSSAIGENPMFKAMTEGPTMLAEKMMELSDKYGGLSAFDSLSAEVYKNSDLHNISAFEKTMRQKNITPIEDSIRYITAPEAPRSEGARLYFDFKFGDINGKIDDGEQAKKVIKEAMKDEVMEIISGYLSGMASGQEKDKRLY